MPDPKKKGDDDEKLDLSKNPVILAMEKAIKGMGMMLTQQGTAQATTNENLGKLIKSIESGKLGNPPKKEEVDPDAINELENSQIIPLVLEEVGKLIDKKLGGIKGDLDKTNAEISNRDVEAQFKSLLADNPDLIEWTGEMKDLSEKTPGLSIGQLYTLAKDGNETKVAEMDEKYKDKSDETGGIPDGLTLSFMPTSGVMAEEGDEKLTKEEAGNKAWDDTMEKFPELAVLGEG